MGENHFQQKQQLSNELVTPAHGGEPSPSAFFWRPSGCNPRVRGENVLKLEAAYRAVRL